MPARQLVLLTGEVDSGKTSWCLAYVQAHPGCDGVLLQKVFRGGRRGGCRVGYDAQRIASGSRVPFARRVGAELAGWREAERVGEFSVSASGKRRANRWLLEALSRVPRTLIVDEIGPLELAGGGLAASLGPVLAEGRGPPGGELILVVRRRCLTQVVERFGLRGCRLIELPARR